MNMDRELREIYADVFRKIPEDRQNAIANILADPEKHGIELMNLFTSGNYAYAGGTDWDDRDKERIDDAREEFELTMGKGYNYVQSGFKNAKDKEQDPVGSKRKFNLKATVNNDESITVRMDEHDSRHFFIFKKEAITGFYYDHPIKGRYAIANHFGMMKKSQNDFCCQPRDGKQLIMNGGGKEIITAVFMDVTETFGEDDRTTYKKDWSFVSQSDSDKINFAYGNEVRYCAFVEAFTAALVNGSRGGVYEWLYQEVCRVA